MTVSREKFVRENDFSRAKHISRIQRDKTLLQIATFKVADSGRHYAVFVAQVSRLEAARKETFDFRLLVRRRKPVASVTDLACLVVANDMDNSETVPAPASSEGELIVL